MKNESNNNRENEKSIKQTTALRVAEFSLVCFLFIPVIAYYFIDHNPIDSRFMFFCSYVSIIIFAMESLIKEVKKFESG